MCGICGITDFTGPVDDGLVGRMSDLIRHRGPDDDGMEGSGAATLGFRRLSIIDIAGSHQPMANEDGTIWLVFNGEIYNYRSLRPELERRGHRFSTTGDGETILHLYEEHGLDFVHHLNGMFAIGLWDSRLERLVLVRDRLGVKPLYYAAKDGRLAFSSETKSLQEVPWVSDELDPAAIAGYLRYVSVPGPLTCFRDVRRVPPGSMLVFDRGGAREHEYWDVEYGTGEERPVPELLEEVEALITDSVRLRMISDVPLGVFLSGGVDSGLVASIMAGLGSLPVEAFSIGFGSEGSFNDELRYSRAVAERYGMNHHVLVLEPSDLLREIERVVWHLDEPCADPAAFLTLALSEFARESVTVSLSGLGGDETFAGYTRHLAVRHLDSYQRVPGLIRSGIRPVVERLPESRSSRSRNTFRRAKRFVRMADHDAKAAWRHSVSYVPAYDGPVFGEALAGARLDTPDPVFDKHWARASTFADPVDRVLYMDTKMYLADQLLLLQDKMSMAVSLEAREPMLDYRLVELAASIPSRQKIHGTTLKALLKQVAEKYMPRECIHRRKQGFGLPLDVWLRGPLRENVDDVLSVDAVRRRGFFQVGYVEWLKTEFYERNRELSMELYHVFLLELWSRMFVDREGRPTPVATGRRDAA
jgi:asparagine synthase (glutamine-hydrolysing)